MSESESETKTDDYFRAVKYATGGIYRWYCYLECGHDEVRRIPKSEIDSGKPVAPTSVKCHTCALKPIIAGNTPDGATA